MTRWTASSSRLRTRSLWRLTPLLSLSLVVACADKATPPPQPIGLSALDVAELNTPVPRASLEALEDSEAGKLAKGRDDAARDDWIVKVNLAWRRVCAALKAQGVAVECSEVR